MSNEHVDKAEVLKMLADGCTPMDIARKLGVSQWCVRIIVRESGTKFTSGPKSRVDDDRLRELVKQRKSLRQIALEFGVVPTTIRTHMQRLGLRRRTTSEAQRDTVANGEGSATLNAQKVQDLRAKRRRGASYAELGREHGISANAAREAADGFTWGHIPIPVCTEIREVDRG